MRKYTVEGCPENLCGGSASNPESGQKKSLQEHSLEVTILSFVTWSLVPVSVIEQRLTSCF